MNTKAFFKQLLTDIKIDATQKFDRNFETKSFFGQKWHQTQTTNHRGSLLLRKGVLRRSIKSTVKDHQVIFRSSLLYASLQNQGGAVTVTAKMKRFFWAMYYKTSGAIKTKKDGTASHSSKNQRLSTEAQRWKAMALQKQGNIMKIKQRQFIGDHPEIKKTVTNLVTKNMKEFSQDILKQPKK